MPGGYGNIRATDNPKPFKKGDQNWAAINRKWTDEKIVEELTGLANWLLEETPIVDAETGDIIGYEDAGNVFYREYFYKKGHFFDFKNYINEYYPKHREKIRMIEKIQEYKLQKLALEGKTKEGMTKYILSNIHGWSEKVDNKNENSYKIVWNEEKSYKKLGDNDGSNDFE